MEAMKERIPVQIKVKNQWAWLRKLTKAFAVA